ncbi:hypothetical protein D7S70_08545 [Ralstonia pickettii]|jgi:hypothetical protein|nr:hypothetical protein [Ralstonia pickettii]MBB0034469.1 hypothetical protein [Ralstonia pickettii]MBB0097093.1 hypothetical protein [Ralstonia pickettii]MBB0106937.1 hypothetical protein [Ralstonia pickettii]MBB0127866.1 hypothetical protein [Ralstonia pickettii]
MRRIQALREFFEVERASIVIAALKTLADGGELECPRCAEKPSVTRHLARRAEIGTRGLRLFAPRLELFTRRVELFTRRAELFAPRVELFARRLRSRARPTGLFARLSDLFASHVAVCRWRVAH